MSNYTITGTDLEKVKQPYYDIELAKISIWLRMNKLTMHVKLDGSVSFKKKGCYDQSN
jgi:hypothetical protein